MSGSEISLSKIQKLMKEFLNLEMLQNLQLLLGVKFNNVLLRIVFELINVLLETTPQISIHFLSTFTIDILLKIFEDYGETELKISALDCLSNLCKEDNPNSVDAIFLLRKLGGPSKLINQIQCS
jgi:hypothetical protein